MNDQQKRENLEYVGKFLISYLIMTAENSTPDGGQSEDWIDYILNTYSKYEYKDFLKSFPKIITFNYDNLLENLIFNHLIYNHHLSVDQAQEQVLSLPIFHVYGDLGNFPRKPLHSSNSSHQEMHLADVIEQGAKRIKVISGDRKSQESSDSSKKIKEYLAGSSRIYFLGYGFDEQNNSLLTSLSPKLLRSNIFSEADGVYSTSIGLEPSDINKLTKELELTPINLGKKPEHVTCLQLLKNIAPLVGE